MSIYPVSNWPSIGAISSEASSSEPAAFQTMYLGEPNSIAKKLTWVLLSCICHMVCKIPLIPCACGPWVTNVIFFLLDIGAHIHKKGLAQRTQYKFIKFKPKPWLSPLVNTVSVYNVHCTKVKYCFQIARFVSFK